MTSEREQEVTNDDTHTSLIADLQEEQDKEVETIMAQLPDKVSIKRSLLNIDRFQGMEIITSIEFFKIVSSLSNNLKQ
jgi:hypothetical protein